MLEYDSYSGTYHYGYGLDIDKNAWIYTEHFGPTGWAITKPSPKAVSWNPFFRPDMENIKKVIFNDPATIVYWSDGSKTVVKRSPDEEFDPEKGLAMAMVKRMNGNKGSYFTAFKTAVLASGYLDSDGKRPRIDEYYTALAAKQGKTQKSEPTEKPKEEKPFIVTIHLRNFSVLNVLSPVFGAAEDMINFDMAAGLIDKIDSVTPLDILTFFNAYEPSNELHIAGGSLPDSAVLTAKCDSAIARSLVLCGRKCVEVEFFSGNEAFIRFEMKCKGGSFNA